MSKHKKEGILALILGGNLLNQAVAACSSSCNYKDGTLMTNELDSVYWTSDDVRIRDSDGGINVGDSDNWPQSACCADRTMWYISGNLLDLWPRYSTSSQGLNVPGDRKEFDFRAEKDDIYDRNLVVFTHEDADGNIYGSTYFMLAKNDQMD